MDDNEVDAFLDEVIGRQVAGNLYHEPPIAPIEQLDESSDDSDDGEPPRGKQLTLQQRIKLVFWYGELKNYVHVSDRFSAEYVGQSVSRQTVAKIIQKFNEHGSVRNMNKGKSGRRITVTTPERKAVVEHSIEDHPKISLRRRSQQLQMSVRSLQRVIKDLKFHPYKLRLHQALTPEDHISRRLFCDNMIGATIENPDILDNLFMSDESYFYLNGTVNTHNCVYWSRRNPHYNKEIPLHSPSVLVWSAISSRFIIGPYFFTGKVNQINYLSMLQDFFIPQLVSKGIDPQQVWFQQDGAPGHRARSVINFLKDTFPAKLIAKGSNFDWPARSPDLTACDYFLWGCLKQRVFSTSPATLNALKLSITAEINRISPDLLRSVFQNFLRRLHRCSDANGKHFEN